MQDKHIDEELVQIFTDIADNLLMHKATPRSEFHLDLDRVAVQKIKALITIEQLAIWEKALELIDKPRDIYLTKANVVAGDYGDDVARHWDSLRDKIKADIQQQIDKLGGGE